LFNSLKHKRSTIIKILKQKSKIMKSTTLKLGALVLAGIGLFMSIGPITSCTKTNTVTKTDTVEVPVVPQPPSNPSNATSANGIDSLNLVAYWPFDNSSLTEKIQSLAGVGTNVRFPNGVKGTCFQGNGGAYAVYANPGTALPALQSFSLAFWINADQPIANPDTAILPGLGAQGLFDLANVSSFWANLHIDFEPRRLADGKTPDPDTLDMKVELTSTATGVSWSNQFPEVLLPGAVGRWSHVVITYDGPSGTFTIYLNGTTLNRYGYAYGPFMANSITLYANDPGSSTNTNGAAPLGNLKFANASALVIGTWQLSTNPSLTSGSGAQPWASGYTGGLDELRVYKDALSANDANSLYILEKAGF